MLKDNKAKGIYLTLLSLLIFLVLLNSISAFGFNNLVGDTDNIGIFKQGDVSIIQTCDNCTYVNITSIYFPQESRFILKEETIMNQSGTLFNYTQAWVNQTGTYVVTGHGDENGDDTSWVLTFQVGTDISIGVFIIILVIAFAIAMIGIYIKNEYFAGFGGMALGILGIFTFNNGITVYRSWITDAFSLFVAGLGIMFIAMAMEEWLGA